jgi:hypothetical protein
VGLANLGSESETCVGSCVHLVGAFISFENNFYRLLFTPPSLVLLIGPSPRHVARLVSRSSSTTLLTSRVRVPRHVARLVVDYFAYVTRPGASARRAARRRLLRAPRLRLAATMALLQPRRASRLLVSRQHWLYFEYASLCRDVVFRLHHIDHSPRLVFQTSQERQSRPQQIVGINSD